MWVISLIQHKLFVRHENADALEYINRRAGDRNRKWFQGGCEHEERLGLYVFWKSLRVWFRLWFLLEILVKGRG